MTMYFPFLPCISQKGQIEDLLVTLYSALRSVIWSDDPNSQETLWDSCVVWKPQADIPGPQPDLESRRFQLGEDFLEGWRMACQLALTAPQRPPFPLPADLRIFPPRFTEKGENGAAEMRDDDDAAGDGGEQEEEGSFHASHPSLSLQELEQLLVRDVSR